MRSRREGNRGDCERAFLRLCVVARTEDVTFVEAGICAVSVELVQMVVFFPMCLCTLLLFVAILIDFVCLFGFCFYVYAFC